MNFSKLTLLHNVNAIIWTFRDLKMPFLTISTSRQSISERFAAWKQNSWILAERPPSMTGLPVFYRFKAWKCDSWDSSNRPISRAEQPICERFQASKHVSRVSANIDISWIHCTFLIVSRHENAISERQQINLIAAHTAHTSLFRTVKPLFMNFSKSTLLHNGNAIILTFGDLKMSFLTISK